MSEFLGAFVQDFAAAVKRADAKRPVAVNKRSKKPFKPSIGPRSERDAIRLVSAELQEMEGRSSSGLLHLNVPYSQETRRRCDLCVGDSSAFEWAIEVKMSATRS